MLDWYRQLIRLRRASPSLNDGDLKHTIVSFDEEKRWLRMDRGEVKVICNFGDGPAQFADPLSCRLLLASRTGTLVENGRMVVPPECVVIFSAEVADC